MRSAVFLAAMMPAIRAAPITSPFLASPARIAASVAAAMRTLSLGDRDAACRILVRHVDHPRFALSADMGERRSARRRRGPSVRAPFAQAFAPSALFARNAVGRPFKQNSPWRGNRGRRFVPPDPRACKDRRGVRVARLGYPSAMMARDPNIAYVLLRNAHFGPTAARRRSSSASATSSAIAAMRARPWSPVRRWTSRSRGSRSRPSRTFRSAAISPRPGRRQASAPAAIDIADRREPPSCRGLDRRDLRAPAFILHSHAYERRRRAPLKRRRARSSR